MYMCNFLSSLWEADQSKSYHHFTSSDSGFRGGTSTTTCKMKPTAPHLPICRWRCLVPSPDCHRPAAGSWSPSAIWNSFRLNTNIQKSNVSPIQCSEQDMAVVHTILPSGIQDFPCKYLGPSPFYEEINEISITAFDIENCWYREIADCLPGWKAELLNRADLAIFVQSMLTTTLVYSATALDLPPWCLKAMDKLRRNFLWRGRKEANGGHCLIAWPKVSRPKELVCTCVCWRDGLIDAQFHEALPENAWLQD